MHDLLLRQCRLLQTDRTIADVDIAIQQGVITAIAPHIEASAKITLDIQQQLVSPPFV